MDLRNIIARDYPNFRDKGIPACATTDPEIFFPPKGAGGGSEYGTKAARRMCMGCPYRVECLNWAIKNSETGIWGGTTERDRKALRRERHAVA